MVSGIAAQFEGHEAPAASAEMVDAARQDFFSRPGFAFQDDRQGALGELLEPPRQLQRRRPHHPTGCRLPKNARARVEVLGRHAGDADPAAEPHHGLPGDGSERRTLAVHVTPILAVQVFEHEQWTVAPHPRVLSRHSVALEPHVAVGVPPEHLRFRKRRETFFRAHPQEPETAVTCCALRSGRLRHRGAVAGPFGHRAAKHTPKPDRAEGAPRKHSRGDVPALAAEG